MIDFACTSCKSHLQVPDDKAGQSVICSRCNTLLTVPSPSPSPEDAVAVPGSGPRPRPDASPEVEKVHRHAGPAPRESKGPARAGAALDPFKKFDSQLDQASRALIDALSVTEKEDNPAIFLKENYLGGRTRRGLSMEFLKGTTAMILTIIFSWAYILIVLWLLGSAWQFLPLRKTEFLAIRLRRRARLAAVIPFAIAYFARLLVAYVVVGLLLGLAGCFSAIAAAVVKDVTPLAILGLAGLVGGGLLTLWYLYCNYTLSKMLRNVEEEGLLEYQAVVEYGYPRKVALIKGISSAGLEKQLAGLMTLCDTLSNTEFSPWEQVTLHGARQGLISRTLGGLKSMVAGN